MGGGRGGRLYPPPTVYLTSAPRHRGGAAPAPLRRSLLRSHHSWLEAGPAPTGLAPPPRAWDPPLTEANQALLESCWEASSMLTP